MCIRDSPQYHGDEGINVHLELVGGGLYFFSRFHGELNKDVGEVFRRGFLDVYKRQDVFQFRLSRLRVRGGLRAIPGRRI